MALWGPGGVGKSTLAAEFVRATWGPSPARVAWVGALGRPEFGLATLLDEVATQLGREDLRKLAPEAKAVQVAALVSGTPTLVVLDNFETIAGAEQARCLDFLARQVVCPALITTRSRANHEDVYNVPLAAMTLGEAHDLIRRLVGQTRRPSNFDRLDRDDLIRRCEANPLVLHWVVRQIDLAQRPQDVLDDLARGEGDAAERVFTRSFNLPQLGDDGRAALLALSLFTPDASREALAEVAGFGDDVRRLDGAVGSLSSLWLVEATEGNERLFLRGLTRELAKSRLLEGAFAEECGQSYVAHFLGYAGAHGGTTAEDLDALDAERSNLLGALDVAFKMQDWQGVVSLSHALDSFLNLRGYWDEGVECAKKAEAAARALGDEDRAAFFKAYAAMIRVHRGEYEEARKTYQATLEMVRRLGNERAVAACLHQLGGIALAQDRFEEARPLYRACLEIHNRLGDLRSIAVTQHELGRLEQNLGNLEEARRLYQESLESHRRRGDFENVSSTL
ncbi:MAG TPA: tetratricopeptide repeat protein, partial [Pyrinomonadaceae bacterium]